MIYSYLLPSSYCGTVSRTSAVDKMMIIMVFILIVLKRLSALPMDCMIRRVSKTPRSCSSECAALQKPELVLWKLGQRLLWTFQRCLWFHHRLLGEGTDEQGHSLEVFALEMVAEQGGEERPSHRTVRPATLIVLFPNLGCS